MCLTYICKVNDLNSQNEVRQGNRDFLFLWLVGVVVLFCSGCEKEKLHLADSVFFNGNILTMDSTAMQVSALAVREGRIVALGDSADMVEYCGKGTPWYDLEGRFVMPGFIEGHGHFRGLGESLRWLYFLKDTSYSQVLDRIQEAVDHLPEGSWIVGRGWHQEKWQDTDPDVAYPDFAELDRITEGYRVMLIHASGHSLLSNDFMMREIGLLADATDPVGGRIVRDATGRPNGVLEERAMDLIRDEYDKYIASLTPEEEYGFWLSDVQLAVRESLAHGITSFQDAGSSMLDIQRYSQLAREDSLGIRLWAMLRHPWSELDTMDLTGWPVGDIGGRFESVAVKSELDGALGSYGAWLLKPYSDKPGFSGQNTTRVEDVVKIADLCLASQAQLCVHAIGDRANRIVLDIFEHKLQGPNTLRWRVEHAQHLHPDDIPRFAEYDIIASMQGVHCTSDAPFVVKRLGQERARIGAYAWRSLLDHGVLIANGTDAPVEDVNPLPSIYASVSRQSSRMNAPFFPSQAMTRMEALKSYTLDNAYAAFQEDDKGSLSPGKYADFIVLSDDLLHCADDEILTTRVLETYLDGRLVYRR